MNFSRPHNPPKDHNRSKAVTSSISKPTISMKRKTYSTSPKEINPFPETTKSNTLPKPHATHPKKEQLINRNGHLRNSYAPNIKCLKPTTTNWWFWEKQRKTNKQSPKNHLTREKKNKITKAKATKKAGHPSPQCCSRLQSAPSERIPLISTSQHSVKPRSTQG
jgi:hypothetical protein